MSSQCQNHNEILSLIQQIITKYKNFLSKQHQSLYKSDGAAFISLRYFLIFLFANDKSQLTLLWRNAVEQRQKSMLKS